MEKPEEVSLDPLYEWAVWGTLASIRDLELILLKGHLLIECVLDTVLKRQEINVSENYSFHQKILILKEVEFEDALQKDLIVSLLIKLNRLRNKLAHEALFDIQNGDFEAWSVQIMENFKGTKFTKYTSRTKIAHSFSVLSKNLLELK